MRGQAGVQKHMGTQMEAEVNSKCLPVLFSTPCLETDSARPVALNLWVEQSFHGGLVRSLDNSGKSHNSSKIPVTKQQGNHVIAGVTTTWGIV